MRLMIPEPADTKGTESVKGVSEPTPAVQAAVDAAREIDELSFLVGTSCSRTITLLMQPDSQRAALGEELRFLAEKAGRLATLIGEGMNGAHAALQGGVSRTEAPSDTIIDDGY